MRYGPLAHIRAFACLACLLSLGVRPAEATEITSMWTGAVNSSWDTFTSGNWNPAIPVAGYTAEITGLTATNPTIDDAVTVDNLTLDTSSASVTVQGGSSLSLNATAGNGVISNAGTIALESVGGCACLIVSGPSGGTVTLTGAGTLNMTGTNTGSDQIYASGTGLTFNNESTIQGFGQIGTQGSLFTLNNSGTINVNSAGNALVIGPQAAFNNTGTLEATGGGILNLGIAQINSTGGTIQATGTGSKVNLVVTTITGGTLATASGGVIQEVQATEASTLAGAITLSGTLNVLDNTGLNLTAGMTLTINASFNGTVGLLASSNAASLVLTGGNGTVTLNGAGVVNFGGTGGQDRIYASAAGMTLANGSTIQGYGSIGPASTGSLFTLSNVSGGIVDANTSGKTLTLDSYAIVSNSGTLEATNGGNLLIQGNSFTNNSGGLVLANGGPVTIDTTITNNGTFETATAADKIKVTGAGFTNFSGTTLTGGTYKNQGILQFPNANIVTNQASIWMVGPSAVIEDESATPLNALRGFSTNGSGGFFLVEDGFNYTPMASFVNEGGLNAGNGSTLTFSAAGGLPNSGSINALNGGTVVFTNQTITNTGGSISALSGGTVTMTGTTINGGALTAEYLGSVSLQNTAIDNGAVNNAGTITTGGAVISGTTVNSGLIQVNSGQLDLSNNAITNTGGAIQAGSNTVLLNGSSIMDGTLASTGPGLFQQSGAATTLSGSITLNGTLSVADGSALNLSNGLNLTNNGTLNLNATSANSDLVLNGPAGSQVTLSGTGVVNMGGTNGGDRIYTPNGTFDTYVTLVNSNTIQGYGTIGVSSSGILGVTNSGIIDANTAGTTLTVDAVIQNAGTVEATNGGTLALHNGLFSGGTILDVGSTVTFFDTVLSNLTITNEGGLIQEQTGLASFDNISSVLYGSVTLNGTLSVASGDALTFWNGLDLTNNGTLSVNGGGNILSGLVIQANERFGGDTVILNGPGVINLNDARIYINNGEQFDYAMTLVNNSTIQGFGGINNVAGEPSLAVNNTGTINADVAGMTLTWGTPVPAILTNTGVLEATNGGILNLVDAVDNTNGNILADSNSTVAVGSTVTAGTVTVAANGTLELDGGTISGGTVNNSGIITTGGSGTTSSLFGAVTNNASGNMNVVSGTTLILNGDGLSTYTNAGNITLTDGTLLIGSGGLTLQGGGTLTMNGTGLALIGGISGSPVLTNTDNTIQGFGTIGNGAALGFVNSGTVTANVSGGILDLANTGVATNTGTGVMQAIMGGTLLFNGDVSNAGSILADNGTVTIAGTTTNSGMMQAVNGGMLNLVGVDNASGGTIEAAINGTVLITGTLTNSGAVQANGGNLNLSGNVNNTGGTITAENSGTITMGGATNAGVMQANTGGMLNLLGDVNNAGGAILAGIGGTVSINGTVSGGVLESHGSVTISGAGMATGAAVVVVSGGALELDGGTITGGSVDNSGLITTGGISTGSSLFGAVTNEAVGNINIASGTALIFDGSGASTYTNKGAITINDGATLSIAGGTVNLMGGGTVTMSGAATIGALSGSPVLNNIGNTIQGAGNIGGDTGMGFANGGTVTANVSGGTLTLGIISTATNTGLMQANNGGTLDLMPNIDNTGGSILAGSSSTVSVEGSVTGGTVTAASGGTLLLNGGTISGGTVTNSGLIVTGVSTLDSLFGQVTNHTGANINVAAGTTLVFDGSGASTYTNNGTITINGGATLSLTGGTVNLTGGGTLMMSGAAAIGDLTGPAMLNNIDNTIQGTGNIGNGTGMGFMNAGTVTANVNGGTLTLDAASAVSNTGLMQANNFGTLDLAASIDNTAGNILADNHGTISVEGVVTGGTVTVAIDGRLLLNGGAITGGAFVNGGPTEVLLSSTLGGTITNSGAILVMDNATLAFNGGAIVNRGSITLASNSNPTGLTLNSAVTLSGGGRVSLSNSLNNSIGGAGTLTNADNLIQGSGNIGGGTIGFINSGTVVAEGTIGGSWYNLTIQPGSAGFTNNGTLSVSGGYTMVVDTTYGSFTNLSGTTLTGGTYNVAGTLQFRGGADGTFGDIQTNNANLILDGAAAAILDQGRNNALANLASNLGTFTLEGGANLPGLDALDNTGSVTIGAGSTLEVTTYTNDGGQTTVNGVLRVSTFNNLDKGVLDFSAGTILYGNLNNSSGAVVIDPGAITVTGNYTQGSAGTLDIDIASLLSYDQLEVSGTATLDGTLDIILDGYSGTPGDMFEILTSTGLGGTNFATISLSGNPLNNGLFFQEIADGSNGCPAGDVCLDVAGSESGVPEPSSWLLMAGGLAALLRARYFLSGRANT